MPKQQQYKIVKATFAAILFFVFSVVALPSFSADLGHLTVLSSLGQPLRAEVELLDVKPEVLPSIKVSLAPVEAYKLSGIDYTPFLQSLKISVENKAERNFISIRSLQPVNEPYVGLLLELESGNERKGNEYFIMLDPEEWTNLRSAPLSSAASIESLAKQQREGRKFSQSSGAVASPGIVLNTTNRKTFEKKQDVSQETKESEYKVSRGESLSKIAGNLGYKNVSLEQILVVLYRNNPDAFLNENMNLLKEGAILSIPNMDKGIDTSQKDAQAIVKLHAANFREYSLKLADAAQRSVSREHPQTTTVSQGKITTQVNEKPTPVNQSTDRLELSKAQSDLKSKGISTEEKIALNKAIEETNQRITELEKNVNELRSLLNVVSNKGKTLVNPAETVISKKKLEEEKKEKNSNKDQVIPTIKEIEKNPLVEERKSPAEKIVDEKQSIEKLQDTDKKNAEEEELEEDEEDENIDEEDEKELVAQKKNSFLQNLQNNTTWHIVIGVVIALLVLITLVLKIGRSKKKTPVVKSSPSDKEKLIEDINPNIISGKDYLENLTAQDVLEDVSNESPEKEEEIIQQNLIDEELSKNEEFEAISFVSLDSATLSESDLIDDQESNNNLIDSKDIEEEIQFEEISSSSLLQDDDDVVEDSDQSVEKSVNLEDPIFELNLADINLELDDENNLSDNVESNVEKDEDYNAEMAAKLELALAYIDMKDMDGARELLEEVVVRGTPQQVLDAEKALQSL